MFWIQDSKLGFWNFVLFEFYLAPNLREVLEILNFPLKLRIQFDIV